MFLSFITIIIIMKSSLLDNIKYCSFQ